MMKPKIETIFILFTPRSLGIFLLHYFAAGLLGIAIMMLSVIVLSGTPIRSHDILPLSELILPLLLAVSLMLYFPRKYRCRAIFDSDKKHLTIMKRGAARTTLDLYDAEAIISKKIFAITGSVKNILLIENASGALHTVFDEDSLLLGARRWETFSKRLSDVMRLPLKKEYLYEQRDGTLLSKSPGERVANRKHSLIVISIPIVSSLIGAAIYKYNPTVKVFVLSGVATVTFNLLLSFLYGFLHRTRLGDWGTSNFRLIIYVLSLLVPFVLYYLFLVMMLNGFRWPLSK